MLIGSVYHDDRDYANCCRERELKAGPSVPYLLQVFEPIFA
jgi:hypothetical protein